MENKGYPSVEYLIWIMLAQETEDRWEGLRRGGLGGLSGGERLVGADSFLRQDNCIYILHPYALKRSFVTHHISEIEGGKGLVQSTR